MKNEYHPVKYTRFHSSARVLLISYGKVETLPPPLYHLSSSYDNDTHPKDNFATVHTYLPAHLSIIEIELAHVNLYLIYILKMKENLYLILLLFTFQRKRVQPKIRIKMIPNLDILLINNWNYEKIYKSHDESSLDN